MNLLKHLVVTGTYICQKFLITQKNVVRSFLHHRKISNFSGIIMKNQLSRFTKKSIRNEKQNSTFGNDYNVDLAWVLTD